MNNAAPQVLPVSFQVPLVPPSMNAIHQVIYSLRRVKLKPEVAVFKTRVKEWVPCVEVKEQQPLKMLMEVHDDFYYKNGKVRKLDIQNLGKVVIDAVAEKMGFKDECIWEWHCRKWHNTNWSGMWITVEEVKVSEEEKEDE